MVQIVAREAELTINGSGPPNAIIDTNGLITWQPQPGQVPSTNLFTTVVTDYNPDAINAQQLSATNQFTVVVTAVHNGPAGTPTPAAEPPANAAAQRRKQLMGLPLFKKAGESLGAQIWHVDDEFNPTAPARTNKDKDPDSEADTEEG